jgi:hypothetical protein
MKGTIILGLVAVLTIASFSFVSRDARVAWHKWRLAAAIDNARTAGEGKPTSAQELVALLRGKPRTSAEYEDAWRRHEEALVKLNVLTRRAFTLPKPVASEDRGRIIDAAQREFGPKGLWSITTSSSDSHVVLVTALPSDIPRWEQFMYRFSEHTQLVGRYSLIPTPDVLAQ